MSFPSAKDCIVDAANKAKDSHRGVCRHEIGRIRKAQEKLLLSKAPLDDGTLGATWRFDRDKSIKDCHDGSKGYQSCLFLFWLVRGLSPSAGVEIGTNLGVSTAYQAMAMKLSRGGHFATIEASPYRVRIAKQFHRSIGLRNIEYVVGTFDDTLEHTLETAAPFGYVFVDGDHQYAATHRYISLIVKYAAAGCIIVLDDIRWSKDMEQVWQEISANSRFSCAVDLGSMGVAEVGDGHAANKPRAYSVPLL